MKTRNILALTVLALVVCFASCKPEEEDPVVKSVIQGKITYEDTETGWEGDGKNATINLHYLNNEESLVKITANDTGFYQINEIHVVLNDTAKKFYQISAKFSMTFGGGETIYEGRSNSIELKGNDTIICNLNLKN